MNEFVSRFGGSDVVALTGIVVAAVVAIFVYVLRRKPEAQSLDYQRRQTEIVEEQRQEERAKAEVADIRVSIRPESYVDRRGRRKRNDHLEFVNVGAASALNVNAESFESREPGRERPGRVFDVFPVPELLPGDHVSCPVNLWGDSFEIVTTWEDSRGPQRKTQIVTR
jgi:hypothetical protein